LMAVFFVLHWDSRRSNRLLTLFVAALFLGLATVTVPTVLAYVPLLVLTLWSGKPAVWLARGLVVMVAVAIPLGSWALRNYLAYDQFLLVNKAAGASFWTGNNETYYQYGKRAVAPSCAPGFESTRYCIESAELNARLAPSADSGIEVVNAFDSVSWQHGLDFVRSSPGRFVLLTARKALQFWSPIPDAVQATDSTSLARRGLISTVTYIPVLALAIVAAVMLRRRWKELLPPVLYIAALTATYSVFLPQMRYRLPIDFLLAVFAAYSLSRLTGLDTRSGSAHDDTGVVAS
jgi:hypothetical protein